MRKRAKVSARNKKKARHNFPMQPDTLEQPRQTPSQSDYLLFFLGIPAGTAVLFSLVGVRLTLGMPYLDSLGYLLLHMFIAWWSVSLGATLVKTLFKSWRPPVIAVCSLGYFILLVPTAFIYQNLGDWYGSMYPTFAANRADDTLPSWGIDYLVHFVRYSIPALPLFLAGVFGHRALTGVQLFSYPPKPRPADEGADTEVQSGRALVGMFSESKLPNDAELIAIKAEQHYIQLWTTAGTDLIRFRFKDVEPKLEGTGGGKVHRSWWVNFDHVRDTASEGRKMELVMDCDPELRVPVSTSYKNATLAQLETKVPAH